MDYMFIRYHRSQTCVYGSFYHDKDKGRQNQDFLHYFVAHGILVTVRKKGKEFQKLIHNFPMSIKIVIVPLKKYVRSYQYLYLTIYRKVDYFENNFQKCVMGFLSSLNNIAVLERIYHIRHELFMNTHVFRLIQEGCYKAWRKLG